MIIPSFSFAQGQTVSLPSAENIMSQSTDFIFKLLGVLPQGIGMALKDGINIAEKTLNLLVGWGKIVWARYLEPQVKTWERRLLRILNLEIQKRQPIIQQEFKKEEQEVQKDIQRAAEKSAESAWERLKEMIRDSL